MKFIHLQYFHITKFHINYKKNTTNSSLLIVLYLHLICIYFILKKTLYKHHCSSALLSWELILFVLFNDNYNCALFTKKTIFPLSQTFIHSVCLSVVFVLNPKDSLYLVNVDKRMCSMDDTFFFSIFIDNFLWVFKRKFSNDFCCYLLKLFFVLVVCFT